jgi:hypothetical protein
VTAPKGLLAAERQAGMLSNIPLPKLTPEEARWLAAWRGMDLRRQREILSFMEGTARRFPARKPVYPAKANGIRLAVAFGSVVTR